MRIDLGQILAGSGSPFAGGPSRGQANDAGLDEVQQLRAQVAGLQQALAEVQQANEALMDKIHRIKVALQAAAARQGQPGSPGASQAGPRVPDEVIPPPRQAGAPAAAQEPAQAQPKPKKRDWRRDPKISGWDDEFGTP